MTNNTLNSYWDKFIKNEKYNLILQPMTHPEILRSYLSKEGFEIIGEDVVSDMTEKNAKVYQIINARYTDVKIEYSNVELLFGKQNIERGGEEFLRLCQREAKINKEIVKAKISAGQNALIEQEILSFAEDFLNKRSTK